MMTYDDIFLWRGLVLAALLLALIVGSGLTRLVRLLRARCTKMNTSLEPSAIDNVAFPRTPETRHVTL
jgi:hypothetical protein